MGKRVDMGADEWGYIPFGMEVISVTGDANEVTVITTGAQYVLSRTGMELWRRIDPNTNSVNPRLVATLAFDPNIGPLSIGLWSSREATVESDKATFDFNSDSFFLVTAKGSFSLTHRNRIENAPWNVPFEEADRDVDRQWTDGYGGSLHASLSRGTAGTVTDANDNATTISLSTGKMTAHMVFPPRLFDFEGLYGEGSRPFVNHVYYQYAMENYMNNTENPGSAYYLQNFVDNGFGIFLLWTTTICVDHDPCDGAAPLPTLLDSGYMGYDISDPNFLKEFVEWAHDTNDFKVIFYMANPSRTNAWIYPEGHPKAGERQEVSVTLEWMRKFQDEYDLDGWYFDNGDANELVGDYRFMRQVRTDIGKEGIIYHHDSVDAWDGNRLVNPIRPYSGLRAVMVDTYVNYTLTGETGEMAEVDKPNDPYFRYYTCGYGMSQAYGTHLLISNGKAAISKVETQRLMGLNLNGTERIAQIFSNNGWLIRFKPAYDRKRKVYLNDPCNFDPDVSWPLDPNEHIDPCSPVPPPVSGWYREATNVAVSSIEKGSATVSWDTSMNADSEVSYTINEKWPAAFYPNEPDKVRDDTQELQHSLTLNLLSDTEYEFRIRSAYGDPDTTVYNVAAEDPNSIIWGYVASFETPTFVYIGSNRYDSIQDAIDDANDGDEIVVYPGRYYENIDFDGKAITVRSTEPWDPTMVSATIIDAGGSGYTVRFDSGEDSNSILKGFTITGGSGYGIYCDDTNPVVNNCIIEDNYSGVFSSINASPTIRYNKISGNDYYGIYVSYSSPEIQSNWIYENMYGIRAYGASSSPIVQNNSVVGNNSKGIWASGSATITVNNCIIWDNGDELDGCSATYSCIKDPCDAGGTGNITTDPCFLDAANNNYHLLWGDSSCIDAGDPCYMPEQNETDIDGDDRVIDSKIDMGADEVSDLPLSYWKLDETSGNIAYNSICYGNDGIVFGSPVWWPSSGQVDGALEFDGDDDYINCGEGPGISCFGGENGAISIAAWVKPHVVNKYNCITRHFGGVHYLSAGSDGKIRAMVRDVVNNLNYWPVSNGTISANTWSHIVFILEGGVGYKIYINGEPDRSYSNSNIGLYDYSSFNYIGLGFSSDSFFDGLIDDVRIYNRVLSEDQIYDLAN